jgi:hypothetical protein
MIAANLPPERKGSIQEPTAQFIGLCGKPL